MKSVKQLKRQYYDRFNRDKDSQKFYHSRLWLRTKEIKLARNPLCEACEQAGVTTAAVMVHHSIPVKDGNYKLDLKYLVSLCHACHNKIETEIERERASD